MTVTVTKALHEGSRALISLASLLPNTDICDEIKSLLIDQWAILTNELLKDEDIMISEYDLSDFVIRCRQVSLVNRRGLPFEQG